MGSTLQQACAADVLYCSVIASLPPLSCGTAVEAADPGSMQLLGARMQEQRDSTGVVVLALAGHAEGPVLSWRHELHAVIASGVAILKPEAMNPRYEHAMRPVSQPTSEGVLPEADLNSVKQSQDLQLLSPCSI